MCLLIYKASQQHTHTSCYTYTLQNSYSLAISVVFSDQFKHIMHKNMNINSNNNIIIPNSTDPSSPVDQFGGVDGLINGDHDHDHDELLLHELDFDHLIHQMPAGAEQTADVPDPDHNCDRDHDHLIDCPSLYNRNQKEDMFGCSSILNSYCFSGVDFMKGVHGGGEEESYCGADADQNSSAAKNATLATSVTTVRSKREKVDHSRTLICERKRRGRMTEKLYALRALVPNITKMDKASIVGDVVLYLQELQAQAKKLKAEIAQLESSLERYGGSISGSSFKSPRNKVLPMSRVIIQIELFRIGERGLYVRVVSNKGQGVGASLYRALESLSSLMVQNSNLATISDTFIFTFTLIVAEGRQEDADPSNLRIMITKALLNQGFEFQTAAPSMI
ncbi:hypothetical protein Ancab_012910 [Ancistrocladus abbreviatus]